MPRSRIYTRWLITRFYISRPNTLWKRYVVGFFLIAATVYASHALSLATITAAENDADVLTTSSRQLTRSQTILFLLSEIANADDPQIHTRLEAALDEFEQAHDRLVTMDDLSPELQALYFEHRPISLDAYSRRFVQMVGIAAYAEAREAQELRTVLSQWGKGPMITMLETAADMFQQESKARIDWLHHVQHITLFLAVLVLLLEALLIFLPAQVSVDRAIRRLERRKQQLVRSLNTLKERNADLIDARHHLSYAASHDALTGLLNRRAIYKHLCLDDEMLQGGDITRCVIKVDLDQFKTVNDSLGHNVGDRVLVHVAEILKRETEKEHHVGRVGGDEFVILIENPPSREAVVDLAHRIIKAISMPLDFDGVRSKLGASIGFTIAFSTETTPDQLLIESDLALYEAKRAGQGQVFAYSDELAQEIDSRRTLYCEITQALAGDQFEAYLQPQVDAETDKIYGCEVLARWRHPKHGIVPPGTFIAAAEEAGLVDQIDRIIMEKGLDILEDLLSHGIEIPMISVNASPPTLRDPHLTERLLQEVRARHLKPEQLTIEVLESTLIERKDDAALRTVESLSRAGFSVVLDDFGTGYSSMSNLSVLELNGLKLDQSLVKPIPEPRADSIIAAMVLLSRKLGMTVIAEGVETEAHRRTVRDLGCHVIQGYAVSKPIPKDEFIDWYHARPTQDARARASG